MTTRAISRAWLGLVLALAAAGCATFSEGPDATAPFSDNQIASDILNRLAADPITAADTYGVSVSGGVVTLRGSYREETLRARIVGIAENTPGVTRVIDRLQRW